MTTGGKKVPTTVCKSDKTTGDIERDVKILLADHAQSREEARYRDRLFYQLFYVIVIVVGVLIDALVRADSDLASLFIFIAAFVIFFILSAATWSIKGSRDGAWENSRLIEKDGRVAKLLETNKYVRKAKKDRNWFERMHVGQLICILSTVMLGLSAIGIIFYSVCLIF